jgi:serine protease AprX
MKKYLLSFILTIAIAVIVLSFRSDSGKFGPHLMYMLDNTSENSFIVYVYLQDKGPNALSKLSNPLSLVTQRSIDRRLKVLPPDKVVDITDVPIYEGYVSDISARVMEMRNQIKWLNAVSVQVNRNQLDELSSLNYVKQIEIVDTYRKVKDPESKSSNGFIPHKDNIEVDTLNYGSGSAQITQMNVNLVHNQGIFGQGVLIASLDDGFRNQTHQCFINPVNPLQIVNQYDFQLHLPGAFRTNDGHGTTTISCIGAYDPGNLVGVSFKSSFLVARTEVDSFERNIEMDNWAAAAQWADSLGADVITSSLGYGPFDAGQISYTWQQMDGHTVPVTLAAVLAVHKGITVFNSAGNNGYDPSHNTLGAPADGDSVITLGAVKNTGVVTSFSSCGPTTDNPPRIKPDVMAMGEDVTTANGDNNGYSNFSAGTSYSCPLAAGVGGLILSANKSLTPLQVRGIMRKFASNTNSPNNQYGWGIINAQLSVDSARKLDNALPVITHIQPFTYTTSTVAITLKAKITDNGIIRNWTNQAPLLYFRKSTNNGSTWTAYTAVTAANVNLDTFFFPITGSTIGSRVEYYFAAQDIALPTPKMSTLPAGGSGVTPPGSTPPSTRFTFNIVPIGITSNSNEIPSAFKLYNNYPNPFNPNTKIKFDIPKSTFVKLIVYDVLGREVETLVNTDLKAASYEVDFYASKYASGIYFYKLETASFTDIKKMILIK